MSPWMRKLHKWVGLVIGIQFLLWMASGVMMSLPDADQVQGRASRVKAPAPAAWPAPVLGPAPVPAAGPDPVDPR